MAEFRMPSLGADMEAGTLVEWMVKPGDHVKRGDIIAVVETQKGAIEIEVYETGEIEEILVGLGAKVPVGTPLARIRTEGEAPSAVVAAPQRETAAAVPVTPERLVAAPPIQGREAVPARRPASPAARRLAQTHGIDLSAIRGGGPSGAVTLADVERHLAEMRAAPEKKRGLGIDLNAMRTAIAAAMARLRLPALANAASKRFTASSTRHRWPSLASARSM